MKEVVVQFDAGAYDEYARLQALVAEGKSAGAKPTCFQLLFSLNTAIRNMKNNPNYGDLIPRRYLLRSIVNRYGTDKLLRVELVGFWRLIYTLVGNEDKIIALILEFMDHKKYNKIFGYRKK